MPEKKDMIYEKISSVMGEISAIGKDRKNPQQGYAFRGIDDVYNTVHSALVAYGVFCAPQVIESSREERTAKSGTTLIYTMLRVKYTFYCEDGSSVEVITCGEAMDSGDKSANKAMSAAQKYAFLQLFCIPTEEQKDSEYETHEVKPEGEFDTKEKVIARIKKIKNKFELDNWHKKHKDKIKATYKYEALEEINTAYKTREKELELIDEEKGDK